jgi:NADPH-dependent 2,4-dienoyl-CoA reductase/sulfur reductase-like enzyme
VKTFSTDVVIVGAGAAGMAAALPLARRGFSCALVDREDSMGGILLQCIHNGFGLHHFGEELTGPEFAARLENDVRLAGVPFFPSTTVLSIEPISRGGQSPSSVPAGANFRLLLSSSADGVTTAFARSVILAMGSRERNRGNIRIAGDRPAGVFTAGLAQRLINIDGYLPGKRAVIIGSGDIGLIMARRLTLSGAKVEAVVEIQPFPSGLTRNVVQCLEDFGIPLYLSHATLRVIGKDRVSAVEIAPLVNGAPNPERAFAIPCDTVLLSVGLVPENELSARVGVALNPVTNGAVVDSRLMTNIPGIFSAGNVLHIHDLVDRVAAEADRAGNFCADWLQSDDWLQGQTPIPEIPLRAGKNVRYTVPSSISPGRNQSVSLRSMISMDRAVLLITRSGESVFEKKLSWVRPGEMISVDIPNGVIPPGDATGKSVPGFSAGALEISLVVEGDSA